MTALTLVIVIAAATGGLAWIASLITRDTSWVDRLWSIVPAVYVWVFPALFQVFNLFFIVIAQMALLVLIALPALTAYDNRGTPFGMLDWVLTVVFLAALIGETIADQQQWNFHLWKSAERAAGRTPDPQFLQTGLFRYSRHPNYFFELAQWWILYLFAVTATGVIFQWTIAGAVFLTALFIGSTRFTEQITLSKYPEYAQFQRTTSMIVPWFPRREPEARTA
jgi:steroid 5-alpha reductase family enzyme